MGKVTLELIKCDGLCGNISTTSELFALLLDGWTTCNTELNPDKDPDMHLCPRCTIEILVIRIFKHYHKQELFTYDIWPDLEDAQVQDYLRAEKSGIWLNTWRRQ